LAHILVHLSFAAYICLASCRQCFDARLSEMKGIWHVENWRRLSPKVLKEENQKGNS